MNWLSVASSLGHISLALGKSGGLFSRSQDFVIVSTLPIENQLPGKLTRADLGEQ
jgi:hypothetical protein